ncbi:MAG: acylphosphatase [Candidatus Omnitrophica bacterium]|jgi:acylphosphatase|nr:acylphosphatase [Candidatus Omnitrophota bacterium]
MRKSYHIKYKGIVQGVGFRYTARNVAKSLKLDGWVKNMPDGSVEVMIEGEDKDITEFNQRLQDKMQGYIRNTQINEVPSSGTMKGFEIKVGY